MSSRFAHQFAPLGWQASPIDFSGASADYPFLGIYAVEATQRYMVGTRYITWDGSVYKYGCAGDTLSTAHGCWSGDWQAICQWAQFPTTHEIGANPINITTKTTYDGISFDGLFTKDVLAGGFIALFPGGGVEAMNYGIVGNDAAAAAGTMAIYLDHPLRSKITLATGSAEGIFSPYRHLHREDAGEPNSCVRHPVLGVPMANATTTLPYVWIKTWGPIHCSTPDASVGNDVNNFELVWRHDGSVEDKSTTALGMQQSAGFTLFQDYNDGSPQQGSPFFMLQISV